jgi:hypothetical protein|tara:strand:- start:16038 stop:16424 length:387 start_codon:yes stop_codon:yes gene_type:complete
MSKLLDYIDWSAICDDHKLETGYISPQQRQTIEDLLKNFIFQNKKVDVTPIHEIELEYENSILVALYIYYEGVPRTNDYIGDAPEVEIQSIYLSEGHKTTTTNLFNLLEYNQPLMDFIESEILTKHED